MQAQTHKYSNRPRTNQDALYYVKLYERDHQREDGTADVVSRGEIVRWVDYRGVFVRPGDRDDAAPRFRFIKARADGNCAFVCADNPSVWNVDDDLIAEPYTGVSNRSFQTDRWSQIARMRAAGRSPVEWQHLVPMHGRPVSPLPATKATFVVLRGNAVLEVEIIAKR